MPTKLAHRLWEALGKSDKAKADLAKAKSLEQRPVAGT